MAEFSLDDEGIRGFVNPRPRLEVNELLAFQIIVAVASRRKRSIVACCGAIASRAFGNLPHLRIPVTRIIRRLIAKRARLLETFPMQAEASQFLQVPRHSTECFLLPPCKPARELRYRTQPYSIPYLPGGRSTRGSDGAGHERSLSQLQELGS